VENERDPIKRRLVDGEHRADPARLDQIHAQVKYEVDKAVASALLAPYPNVDKVDQDVYA
jgi:TPP-dependent pyruvate/acetoin dehydrogenase alpha subunit